MDQPYSVVADWLSKFHTWPEFIQALWLVAIPATVLGIAWLVLQGLRDLTGLALASRHWRGHLVYGVYQDPEGRWMVYRHNRHPQEIDWTNPPPDLIGRGEVVQGVFRRGRSEAVYDTLLVMPGLDPGIHVFNPRKKTWIPATSAGMTVEGTARSRIIRVCTKAAGSTS